MGGRGGQRGAGGGRAGVAGKAKGGRAEKAGKMKAGVGNEPKKRVCPNFRTAGRRIRWGVPELAPKTPGPVASADTYYNEQ